MMHNYNMYSVINHVVNLYGLKAISINSCCTFNMSTGVMCVLQSWVLPMYCINFKLYVSAYGGIYLDTDVLVLKSLDPLRVHKLTLGVSGPNEISNGIIIARRGAPFLRMWLENYHSYVPGVWGLN